MMAQLGGAGRRLAALRVALRSVLREVIGVGGTNEVLARRTERARSTGGVTVVRA